MHEVSSNFKSGALPSGSSLQYSISKINVCPCAFLSRLPCLLCTLISPYQNTMERLDRSYTQGGHTRTDLLHPHSHDQALLTTLGATTPAVQGHQVHHVSSGQYLPGYLMGEANTSLTSSNTSRMWTPGGTQHSPPQGRPSSSMGQTHGMTHTRLSSLGPKDLISTSGRLDKSDRSFTRPPSQAGKDRSGAPPVANLYDGILDQGRPSPMFSSMERRQLEMSMGQSFTRTPGGLNVTGDTSFGSVSLMVSGQQRIVPPSPAQIDPFYTQGEAITTEEELDETWVTVYGFPPAAASFIYQQFAQYGNVLKHIISNNGNWMHLHYSHKIQAKKALSKNGRVFGGSIMVGVSPCIDKNVMTDGCSKEEGSRIATPCLADKSQATEGGECSLRTPIRPLTAAYQAASSEHDVIASSKTPQKSSSLLYKAIDYVFSW